MRRLLTLLVAVTLVSGPAPVLAADEPLDALCVFEWLITCPEHYADADGDGYGDPDTARKSLFVPEGRVTVGGDCDDTDPDVHPGAIEAFNGRDDDCSGTPDDVVVVLTELMINPKAVPDDAGEWIEVTNTSPKPVRLDGVTITVGSRTCELEDVLGAGGRLVAARSLDPSLNGGVSADVLCRVVLPNTGGVVTLAAPTGVLDIVDYREWRVPDGASLSLDPSAEDPVTNDFHWAWCPATTPLPGGDFGTPGGDNDICTG